MSFKFNCDDCGQRWELKVKRQGPHYCKDCIEKRRREGRGPVQMARSARQKAEPVDRRSQTANSTGLARKVEMFKWSTWHPLLCEFLNDKVPEQPGVYEIRITRTFERLNGATNVVNIGVAARNLRNRVWDQKACKPSRYLPSALKWIEVEGVAFEVRWFPVNTSEQADNAEVQRLSEFIAMHWELPPGNVRGPRGYGTARDVLELLDSSRPGYFDFSEAQ